jgi:hypothetical protein
VRRVFRSMNSKFKLKKGTNLICLLPELANESSNEGIPPIESHLDDVENIVLSFPVF